MQPAGRFLVGDVLLEPSFAPFGRLGPEGTTEEDEARVRLLVLVAEDLKQVLAAGSRR